MMSAFKLYYYVFTLFCVLPLAIHAQECGTDQQMKAYLKKHPAYAKLLDYQEHKIQESIKILAQTRTEEQIYQIPIVVHILENGYSLIADSQIKSAVANLNDAFRGRGKFSNSPDTKIEFILAQKTTDCQPTTGIIRVDGRQVAGYEAHGMKKQTQGGDEMALKALSKWNNLDYYNIWIVDKIDGTQQSISGFAYYPETSAKLDGMVILANHFSDSEETLIHEMGHAFNLYHTFEGDNSGTKCPSTSNGCGFGWGDCVEDTQAHQRSTSGTCLSGLNDCISESYDDNIRLNHMNYYCASTRFTEGQKQRMRSAIETTSRYRLVISEGKNPPQAAPQTACIPTPKNLHPDFGIRQINLNNLSINSGSSASDNTHYIDHTCMRVSELKILEKYNLSVSGASTKTHIFGAWADWNNDGDFEDIGETIFKNKTGTNITQPFTVPNHAKLNQKLRFRIRADDFTNTTQLFDCQLVNKGQTEDFAIKVTASGITKPEIEVYEEHIFLPHEQATVNFEPTNTGSFSEKTFRIYNVGNQTLLVDNQQVMFMGSSDFSISQSLPTAITSGNFAEFKVRFTPTSEGNKSVTVAILSNDTDENPYRFSLESKATMPVIQASNSVGILAQNALAKDFGIQNLGDKITHEITLKNIGDGKLQFSDNQAFKLTDSENFKVINFDKTTLEVGEEMTFWVQFNPLLEGVHATTLALFFNSSASPFEISFSGKGVLPKIKLFKDNQLISNYSNQIYFSDIHVGTSVTKTFEIRNTGNGYLKIPNRQIISDNSTICQVIESPNEIIPSQKKASFRLIISPKSIESETVKLTIPNNDPEQTPFIFFITISGNASKIESEYDQKVIDNEAEIIDFGTVILGQKSDKIHIQIKNTGNIKLDISKISVLGLHPTDFQIHFTSSVLNPSESGVLEVIFEPTAKAIREAMIILENNSPYQHPYRLKIKGKGIPIEPDIEVEGIPNQAGSATFSNVGFRAVRRRFTLKNTGILPLNLNQIFQIQGQNATEFQVVTPPNMTVLAPEASTTFEVEMNRKDAQEKTARILIFSNDPDENPYSFTLRSDRIPPPPPTAEEILSYPFPEITVTMEDAHFQLVWWGSYPVQGVQFEIYRSVPNQTEPELIGVIHGAWLQNNVFTDTDKLQAATYYTYSIRAVADDLFSEIQTVQILTPPALPKLDYNKKVCEGNQNYLRVIATENTTHFHWYDAVSSDVPLTNETGEVITSNVFQTPVLTESKTYYVAPVGIQFENPNRVAVLAEIEPKPTAKILADSLIQLCDYEYFMLKAERIKNATYVWYWNGIPRPENTPIIQINRSGNYVLEVKTESCRVFSDTVKLEVLAVPKIEFEPNQSFIFCGEGQVSVQEFPDVEYEWFDSDKNFIKKGNKIKLYYSDSLLIKAIHPNGCAVEKPISVTINPYPPMPLISVNNPICEGENVQFSVASIPNATYSWSGYLLKSKAQNPTLAYSSDLRNGTYHLTVNVNGCESFASVNLIIGSKMDYSIKKQDMSCYGEANGRIKVTSHNQSILTYRIGEFGQMQFGRDAEFDSLSFGNQEVIIENEEGCTEYHDVFIDQPADFLVSVQDDKKITSRWNPVSLEAFGAKRYRWFPAEGLNVDTIANPMANPSETTTYTVIGYDENDCERFAQVSVEVLDADEILPHLILSPNGDGLNDVWKIKNIEYFPNLSIEIYTQMGLKIFEQTPYRNDWDGTWQGKWLPAGTYFYKIYLPEENRILGIGDINLIR